MRSNILEIKPELRFSGKQLIKIYDRVQGLIEEFPERIPDILVSEYAEQNRILPTGTPYPGPWRNFRTPYSVEIMNELSARSPTIEVIWIKPSQIGATAIVENFLAYIIAKVPGPAMYVTAKEDLLKKWVNKRLAPLLVSCGLDDKIYAQYLMKGQRRTGNQMFSKEFPGGSLDMVSAQSESNLRQDTVRYLILDEAGKYPWDVQGFGDPIEIARARTANWKSRRKIFIPSTPGLEGECRMWDLFQEGDQRRYFVACPRCGGYQVLKFPSEPDTFYEGFASTAVQWETKGGFLDKDSIHFDCHKCSEAIIEADKYKMIAKGKWVPTAKPDDMFKKSYQLGRLYSLMEDWDRIVGLEMKSAGDPLKMQTHHNHNCGIPYRETSVAIDKTAIYELRGTYKSGTIPSDKVLFLTGSIDVQVGSKTNPDKPPRLEMEICGHGYGYRTWSILYKVFEGPIDDAYDGAWEDVYQFFDKNGAEFSRSDGTVFMPAVVFVDSNHGDTETIVFDFCNRVRGFYPIKGARDLKATEPGRKVTQTLDEANPRDRDSFRLNKKLETPYVMIATNWYKRRLYRSLSTSVKHKNNNFQGNLFCDFPTDYPDVYFDMLVAEEERADHTFWKPEARPNESLDLRVYNMCAGEFWLWLEVQRFRVEARRAGQSKAQSDFIHANHVLLSYAKDLVRKDVTPASKVSKLTTS